MSRSAEERGQVGVQMRKAKEQSRRQSGAGELSEGVE